MDGVLELAFNAVGAVVLVALIVAGGVLVFCGVAAAVADWREFHTSASAREASAPSPSRARSRRRS
jgi:hypothetical protein